MTSDPRPPHGSERACREGDCTRCQIEQREAENCTCQRALMAECERFLVLADKHYAANRRGYARRARVRAAAFGWAAGHLRKVQEGKA